MSSLFLEDVLKNDNKDGYNQWHKKGHSHIENSAAYRLSSNEDVLLRIKPKFKLHADDKYFTIGSCFARNIERKLLAHNADVLSHQIDVPNEYCVHPAAKNSDILNKFNTHSIYNEVYRNLCGITYDNEGLIQVDDNHWFDPQTSYTAVLPKEICLDIRHKIETLYDSLHSCSAVIITLGLTESWIDSTTGIYMNALPPPKVIKKHPHRFKFFNSHYEDTFEILDKTMQILFEKCSPSLKVILTVSPVPLQRTFSGNDIIAANMYSKSILRITAQMISEKYEQVDYYPSYEMVMYSPRQSSWQDDQVHVDDRIVDRITSYFLENYLNS